MDVASPIAAAVVASSVAVAGVIDVRTFRVPNRLTVPLFISGIIYHAVTAGLCGLQASLLGALVGFGILFGLYVLGIMGAGDVKLLTGVGAWLGPLSTTYVFVIAAMATAVYSIIVLLLRGNLSHAFIAIQMTMLQLLTITKHIGAEERVESAVRRKDRRKRLVPFAAMMALAVVGLLLWQWCP